MRGRSRWTKPFSSCWACCFSWPHSPAPRISGLRLDGSSRRLRLQDISSTSESIGCICGAPGTARLLSSSTPVSAARVLAGASSNPRLLDLRVSAPTTGQVWVTAIPGRHREPHAALQMSWLHQFANTRARRCSAHRHTRRRPADEIIHIRESVSEVRSSRRRLTIPVLVVTGVRGADENWRRLQQDQASLSERGCVITAQQSGHAVAIDQPGIIVDAIRTVVETARGHDVPLCATPAASVAYSPPRR
jgi:pimeloyl-ACP methyl ester carboxylesterase